MNNARLASDLQGNTLRVYWYLVNSSKASVGPRDVQRKLGFSSPNLAVYHLDKLVELGVVEKVAGEYHVTRIVDVGILKQFTKIRGFMFPRQVIYASMWTTLFIFYLYEFREVNFYSVFAFLFGLLGAGILWFEALNTWRNRPG
ncbi:MAG: hypothetical protein M1490_04735 [Candidatus Bathyarchaeota archaeon]|nr:hypothetical protein [Candidatus Bathyarchaeota archaeon]